MTETTFSSLKQLRLAQGIELEALAATIKVSPAKLEALEEGRYQELPDATFTRALAMAVCRALKVDAGPVLASLPAARPVNLTASEPRDVPFKATRARLNLDVPTALPWRELLDARWLAPAGVLLAAAAVYFWPQDVQWVSWPTPSPAAVEAAASAAETEAEVGTPLAASTALPMETVEAAASAGEAASAADLAASAPALPGAASAVVGGASAATALLAQPVSVSASVPTSLPTSVAASPRAGSALVMVSTASSWVEVRDAKGAKLLSRHVAAGETIGVDGAAPMSVKIGNAAGIQLSYQGNPIELAAFTRNNVARLELK
ncbi:MAG TPA: helix-turn-helix domain-containing protein [Aquabacterium sp.]|uniref:helix-turn-helix domain-containing protein n=1 Tax=Aquabacterium sp. TaxID=1872578 RepID=UPI002E338645|nr:helix-turn-helix domain-containing protein [Aquabacterium sp.]HEX5374123.1 helix-turn-helix domain-containing protein [Aquabacterium sp.]